MIFSSEQVRLIRQGRMSAVLVRVADEPGQRVQVLRRRVPVHNDDESDRVGYRVEVVNDGAGDDVKPVRLTIFSVSQKTLDALSLVDARDSGFRTTLELVTDWRSRHPRSELVSVVRFAVGDLRDQPRLLSASMARGNYTSSPRMAADGEPEALSEAQLAELTTAARQRDTARRGDQAKSVQEQSLAERYAAIEEAGRRMGVDIHREIHVIGERTERAERRLAATDDDPAD